MSASTNPAEHLARLIVDSVHTVGRHSVAASVIGLALALVGATTYVVMGSLGVDPVRSKIAIEVLSRESGGLLPNQDVTLRGVPIGRVTSVNFTTTGVVARAEIDGHVRVPQHSAVSISALSPAGEQYLNFTPLQSGGPVLHDGSVITEDRTTVPVSLSQLLADSDGMLAQLDPEKLRAITDELRVGNQGPQKLAALLDGGAFLISTVDSVLPQTMSVIRNSRTVLTTLADVNPGLQQTSQNLQHILRGVNAMDGGFRTLMEHGDAPLTALDGVVADNSDTMVQLLGNLTTVAQVASVRTPAIREMLHANRGSALGAIADAVHDDGLWALVDIYPRYACDYDLPRLSPFVPSYPEPYRYTYCKNPDPSVLVRGARNAPRPPGDDTAGPPPDHDPLAQTDPAPKVKSLIPTPWGGSPYPFFGLPPDPAGWTVPPNWPAGPPPDWTPPPPSIPTS